MPGEKQRRENERRRLQRQAQRRRERAARHRRFALIGTVAGVLVIAAVIAVVAVMSGGDTTKKKSTASSPSPTGTTPATTSTAASDSCTWTKSGKASRPVSEPPTTTPSHVGTIAMTVKTTRGPMTFTLNRAAAPCAVESFVSLATQKFYDKTPCHRLTSGTLNVLQCGDPTGTGRGGPGYRFADELTGKEKYTTGVLAMANSGANTNGSQFFIVYKNSTLQPNYTVFGTVTSGLSVVDAVAAKGSDNSAGQGDGKPKLPITITSVTEAA